MPHSTVHFLPGANTTETAALNTTGIAATQLVRYIYDAKQGALIQKLGGWTRYTASTTPSITRALWAWEDTNSVAHLAVGTQTATSGAAQLSVVTNGASNNITPRITTDSIALSASSTNGSSFITISDTVTLGLTNYDTVYIATHIAIGGVVLFGLYTCDPNGFIGTTAYTVQAVNILGNPVSASSTSSSATLPNFSVTINSPSTTVTLPMHGYSAGSTFPVLTATTVGGASFSGNYVVQTVIDASNFTITSSVLPTSTATSLLNGGLTLYIYGFGVGAIPAGTGTGVGGYGTGGYGSGTAVVPALGTPLDATDWVLDNWGQILVGVPIRNEVGPQFQPIYQWDAIAGSPTATLIPNCPIVNDGIFVAMPQRQIIAWGSTTNGVQDPLLIRWCDVGNFSMWAGTVTNQAGQYRLAKGSRIVGGMQTPQQGLIWTDIDVWSMQYIGQPYIYSFNEIGAGCGLIGRKAMGSLGGVVYWMGPSQFYALGSSGVEPIPCPIWDVVFQNLDQTNTSKIRCAVNSRFGEIAWYYPTLSSGGEVAAYVKYNALLNAWDFGALARSAWVDQSVLGPPIGADPVSLRLYQHETSPDADGQPILSSFQSGYAALSEGEQKMFIDQVWPDMKFGVYKGTQNATLNLTFYVADYPGQTPKVFGPYAFTQSTTYISPRFRGRLVSVGISSSDSGSFWRIGAIRYRVKEDGAF